MTDGWNEISAKIKEVLHLVVVLRKTDAGLLVLESALREARTGANWQGVHELARQGGSICLFRGRIKDSLKYNLEALRLAPEDMELRLQVASTHRALGDLSGAESAFRRALSIMSEQLGDRQLIESAERALGARNWNDLYRSLKENSAKVASTVIGPSCLIWTNPHTRELGKRWSLESDALLIGSGSDCDIQLHHDSVSRQHARILRVGEHCFLDNLGSATHSFINDQEVDCSPISDGDLIRIGATTFKLMSGFGVKPRYYEEIFAMTQFDSLTGAHNALILMETLEDRVKSCTRERGPLSLVMFDIDQFKGVSDTDGDLTRDYVLREVSRRLRSHVKSKDSLFRIGSRYLSAEGVESGFVYVLPDTGHNAAMAFAERLKKPIEHKTIEYEGIYIRVTTSVGVTTIKPHVGSETPKPLTLIRHAQDNMRAAQNAGQGNIVGREH